MGFLVALFSGMLDAAGPRYMSEARAVEDAEEAEEAEAE